MILIRSVLYVVWLYGAMAFAGLLWLPRMLTAPKDRAELGAGRLWARLTVWGLRWIVGARVQFRGLEKIPAGACILACKHQSMLDTLVPFLMVDSPAFVLKQELLNAPVLGWYAQAMGMIPIDREAHASALKKLMRAARPARDAGRQIVIFPEGTRQNPGVRGDWKPGVAALYRDLGVPCVPVALDTGRVWAARGLIRRPGVATFEVLEPIPPGLSREAFMETLVTRIESASEALLKP
ncbi:MAG: lysophospholipid acyltransferase family protein [Hyphomonadaceae bacterium]|nr:lysophospholipid acyltransferase family protein [Hyphomonadaceae bacterium]